MAITKINRRKALALLSTGHVALKELQPVLIAFHANGWVVDLRLGRSGREVVAAIERLRAQGLSAELLPDSIGYESIDFNSEPGDDNPRMNPPRPTRPTVWSKVKKVAKFCLRPLYAHRAAVLIAQLRVALRNRAWADRLIRETEPTIVLMNMFHSVGQIDNAVVRAVKRAGLPLFGLTNSAYVGELPCRVARMNHLNTGLAGPEIRANFDLVNRIIAALKPSWTRTLADGSVVFYWDPMRIVAGELVGLGMNRMWCKPGLDFDKVFLFGEFSKKQLVSSGYPEEKIVVAGQPLLDEIVRNQSDPIRQRYVADHIGVEIGTGFLLLNIEPGMEHDYVDAETHWRNFHVVMRACTGHGLPVVLSLHPLCRTEEYRFAESQYGVRISTSINIHELYPKCAVSVSFPCSTNLLAEPFGKPLVIYDFYDMVTRDPEIAELNNLPGSVCARTEEELRSRVAEAIARGGILAQPARISAGACVAILKTVESVVAA